MKENNLLKFNHLLILLLFVSVVGICFYWIATDHNHRPIALIIGLLLILLLFYDKATLMIFWILSSPIINYVTKKFSGYEGINNITIKELFDFDRIVIFMIFVVVVYENNSFRNSFQKKEKVKLTYFSMVFFSLILTFSSLIESYNTYHSLKVTIDSVIVPIMGFYVSMHLFVSEKYFKKFIWACTILASYLLIIGFFEIIITGNILRRIRWPFPFWETYGFVLSFLFMIAIYQYFKSTSFIKNKKITLNRYAVLNLFIICGVFLTLTRAVWLSLSMGIIFLFYKIKNQTDYLSIIKIRNIVYIFFLIFIILFCMQSIFSTTNFTDTEIYQKRIAKISTINNRMETFQFAFKEFFKNPLFGIGFRNFRDYYNLAFDDKNVLFSNPGRSTLHNTYIAILTETGLTGFIFYILILLGFAARVRTFSYAQKKDVRLWGYIGLSLIIIYASAGIAYDPLFDPPYFINKLFFVIMGTFYGNKKASKNVFSV